MSGVVMDRMKAGENDEVATFGGGPGEAGLGNGRGARVMSAHVANFTPRQYLRLLSFLTLLVISFVSIPDKLLGAPAI